MGDEILMKKYIILPMLTTAIFVSANANSDTLVAEYKNMFEKIGEKRIGVDESDIDALKAPFVAAPKKKVALKGVKKEEKTDKGFVLQAILNKSAKISGKWYKLHGEVHGMKIISVRDNYVWLKNNEFRKKLTMGSKNEKISIK